MQKVLGNFSSQVIGRLIANKRKTRKPPMTQARLAALVNVSRETICRIEGGRDAHVATLLAVARELSLTPDEVLPPDEAASKLTHHPLGSALRARRLDHKLTLEECGTLVGVSASALSRFERGKPCKTLASAGSVTDPYCKLSHRKYAHALGFDHPQGLVDFLLEQRRLKPELNSEATLRSLKSARSNLSNLVRLQRRVQR